MLIQINGRRMVTLRTIPAIFFSLMLLAGCDSHKHWQKIDLEDRISDAELQKMQPQRNPNALRFGFELHTSLEEDARRYQPFLEYLSRKTGYEFELYFSPKEGDVVNELGTGQVQFAAMGALSYLQAQAKYGVIPLARGKNTKDGTEYRSVIVTSPKNSINYLQDLRGKRFAFVSSTSTQGYLIPKIILREHGLSLNDFASYFFAGSHRDCATAVITGKADAGGMQDTMALEFARSGLLKLVYISAPYPAGCIAANKNVSADILQKVKHALLHFDPKGADTKGLYFWEKTDMPEGFIEAQLNDYQTLEKWAQAFGLLNEQKNEVKP